MFFLKIPHLKIFLVNSRFLDQKGVERPAYRAREEVASTSSVVLPVLPSSWAGIL